MKIGEKEADLQVALFLSKMAAHDSDVKEAISDNQIEILEATKLLDINSDGWFDEIDRTYWDTKFDTRISNTQWNRLYSAFDSAFKRDHFIYSVKLREPLDAPQPTTYKGRSLTSDQIDELFH